MEGWARFHRKIEDWEWYTDANTFRLFFHLVIKANHADGKWRGQDIKRGQHITSISKLSNALDLSPKQIRLALDKLKSTSEITTVGTNKNTIITVVNYSLYQDDGRKKGEQKDIQEGSQRAIKRQSKGNKQEEEECNNENNINNMRLSFPGAKSKSIADKKLPNILKKYTVEQLQKSIDNYKVFVAKERSDGFKDLKYMNEGTFWNGRYIDYLDENYEEAKPKGSGVTYSDATTYE